jgi:peptidoglycan hydrolase-like protein with peptidoglycan-binding domain
LLYHANTKGVMTHTGVYLGGGYVSEARGAKAGVIKSVLSDYAWTHWAALPGVLTGEVVQTPTQQEQTKQEPSKTVSSASSSEVITMRTLRNNSKGTQVKVLQWLLNTNGYDVGEVDGIFGKKTIAAVKAFQTAKGLDVDGIVGKDTWSAILA